LQRKLNNIFSTSGRKRITGVIVIGFIMSIFLLPVNAVMASADEQTSDNPDNEEVAETMNEEIEPEEESEPSLEESDAEEPAEAEDSEQSDPNEATEDTKDIENTELNKPAQAAMEQPEEAEISEGEAEQDNTPAAISAQAQLGPGEDEGTNDPDSNGDTDGNNGETDPQPPPPPAVEEPLLHVSDIEPYAGEISGIASGIGKLDAVVIVFYPGTENSISTSVEADGSWNIVNTNNTSQYFTPGSVVPIELRLEDGRISEFTVPVEEAPAEEDPVEEEPAPEETVVLADEYEPVQTGAPFNIEFTEEDEINYPNETEIVSNFWELPQGTQLTYTNILNLGQTGEITEEMVNISVIYSDGSRDELEPTLATVIPEQIDAPQPENSGDSIETNIENSSGVVSSGEEQPNEGASQESNQEVPKNSVNDEVDSSGIPTPELLPKTGTSDHTHLLGFIVLSIGLGLVVIEKRIKKQK